MLAAYMYPAFRYPRRPALAAATLAVTAGLTLLAGPALAERAFVSNEDDGTVTVIDVTLLTPLATVQVGRRPRGLVLSRDGRLLYVAVSGTPKCPPPIAAAECDRLPRDRAADGIAVVDTVTLQPLRQLHGVSDPERVELSRDGRELYVTEEDAARLSVLDPHSGQVLDRIAVGREPEGVRASPDGRWVLVTSESGNSVSVIDARMRAVRRTVSVGQRPRDVAFSPDGRFAYVPGEADASLSRIALGAHEPATSVLQFPGAARPMGTALDARRGLLYVSTGHGGSVAVIVLASQTLSGEIQVGGRPWGIALTADGRRLCSADGPAGDVAILDTEVRGVLGKVRAGRGPWGVVIGP